MWSEWHTRKGDIWEIENGRSLYSCKNSKTQIHSVARREYTPDTEATPTRDSTDVRQTTRSSQRQDKQSDKRREKQKWGRLASIYVSILYIHSFWCSLLFTPLLAFTYLLTCLLSNTPLASVPAHITTHHNNKSHALMRRRWRLFHGDTFSNGDKNEKGKKLRRQTFLDLICCSILHCFAFLSFCVCVCTRRIIMHPKLNGHIECNLSLGCN